MQELLAGFSGSGHRIPVATVAAPVRRSSSPAGGRANYPANPVRLRTYTGLAAA